MGANAGRLLERVGGQVEVAESVAMARSDVDPASTTRQIRLMRSSGRQQQHVRTNQAQGRQLDNMAGIPAIVTRTISAAGSITMPSVRESRRMAVVLDPGQMARFAAFTAPSSVVRNANALNNVQESSGNSSVSRTGNAMSGGTAVVNSNSATTRHGNLAGHVQAAASTSVNTAINFNSTNPSLVQTFGIFNGAPTREFNPYISGHGGVTSGSTSGNGHARGQSRGLFRVHSRYLRHSSRVQDR